MARLRYSKEVVGVVAVVVALALGGVALASQLTTSATSVTGCLSPSGDLTKFALGDSPLKSCTGNQVQVHLTGNDLASIVAGTGLTSTTENGAITLSIDPAYALPQGCEVGDIARWNGSNWYCSGDGGSLPS
jgi:hypothetical protein